MKSHKYKNILPKNIILEHYLITEKIGSGSFGEVYIAEDKKGLSYALKVEDKHTDKTKLDREYKVYCDLIKKEVKYIPKMYKYIETNDYNILSLELLGSSLDELLTIFDKKLDIYTVINIGYQIIDIIEKFHNAGYIHRDIKPNNFLIGRRDNASQIYIMDFGLSKKYMVNNKHITEKSIKSLVGTPRYASINVHNGIEPSKRDDLESIIYMLIYLHKGILPWQGIKKNKKKDMHDAIGEMKQNTSIDELTKDMPISFHTSLSYVKQLKFDETPDYGYLKKLFQILLVPDKKQFIWL